jgi:hypothetical protein
VRKRDDTFRLGRGWIKAVSVRWLASTLKIPVPTLYVKLRSDPIEPELLERILKIANRRKKILTKYDF